MNSSDYKTPPQSVLEDIDSTPPNHGTASIAEYQTDTAWEKVSEDLQKTEECEIEIMLQAMLRIIAQKTEDSVGNKEWAEAALDQCLDGARSFLNHTNNGYTAQLRSGIKAYCDGTNEGDRYTATVSALNAIVCHFRSELNQKTLPAELRVPEEDLAAIFQVNDPRVIQSNPPRESSNRKPDIVQIDWKIARTLNGDDHLHDSFEDTVHCANLNFSPKPSERIQDNEKVRWNDVLMTFELKKRKSLKARVIPQEYQNGRLTYENTKSSLKPPMSGLLEADFSSASSPGNSTPTKLKEKLSMKSGIPAQIPQLSERKTRSSTGIGPSSPTVPITALSSSPTGSASTAAPSAIAELSPKTYSGESRKRRLDQVASERSDTGKARKVAKALHPAVQSAIYAAERLSTGAWIKCALGVILLVYAGMTLRITPIDNEMYLIVYDRQSPLAARGFDFITYLPHFVVISLILQRLASRHWDTIAFPSTPENQSTSKEHSVSIRIKDREFEFRTEDASTLYVLTGRGTTGVPVYEAKQVNGSELFLKISWPETVRQREDTIIERVQALGREDAVILDHTPNLLVFESFAIHSTANIRALLYLHSTSPDRSRILCCGVFEKLRPLTELTGLEFWRVYWEIVAVHHTLWREGIQHCDVSLNNLMYRMKDGVPKGVLNDFDLSRLSTDGKREGSRANDRTGTIPFMAIDLLSPEAEKGMVQHLYRHDLESFAWVLFWVIACYDGGREISPRPNPFASWHTSASLTYEKKLAFIHNYGSESTPPCPSWGPVNDAVDYIKEFWSEFYYTKNRAKARARRLKSVEENPDSVMVDEINQEAQQREKRDVELLPELVGFLSRSHGGMKLLETVLQSLRVEL